MTIASEITRINTNISNAYTAASEKGATLPATQNSANLATCINSITGGGGGGSSSKYGATIDTFIGDVNANGVLQVPSRTTNLVFTGVTDINNSGLAYAFYKKPISSVSFPNLTSLSNSQVLEQAFSYCTSLTNINFPVLTTISGNRSFSQTLSGCTSLTNVSFPALTTISSSYTLSNAFSYCTSLTNASFPVLTTIQTTSIFSYTFSGCSALTDIYFNKLKSDSFGTNVNQFNNMMYNTGSTTIHKIHFPSNLESTIRGLTGYPLFGGTSGYVTLVFDLTATS